MHSIARNKTKESSFNLAHAVLQGTETQNSTIFNLPLFDETLNDSTFCARRRDVAGWVAGWLAGWVAVTLWDCIKTAKPIGKFFDHLKAPSF